MNEEPEFRVWCNKEMYYPVKDPKLWLSYSKNTGWGLWNAETYSGGLIGKTSDEEFELLQWIRRKDRNEQKIYQADLVRDKKNKGYIIESGGEGFVMAKKSESIKLFDSSRIEVIGNKFEDPQLAGKMRL